MKLTLMMKTVAVLTGATALLLGVQVMAQQPAAGGADNPRGFHRDGPGKGGRMMNGRSGQGPGMMMARRRSQGPSVAQLDTNDDGVISLEEFLARIEDRPEQLLDRRDENGDGLLSREELEPREGPRRPDMDRAAVQACMQDEHPEFAGFAGIEERFDTLDSNDDSLLDADELAAGRLAQAEERFARLDADADGQLTPEELRAGRPDRRAMGRDLRDCIRDSAETTAP